MRYFGFVVVSCLLAACAGADDEQTGTGSSGATSTASSPATSESAPDKLPTPTGTLHEDVTVSADRVFDLYEPEVSSDGPRPVIIVFHGMPSSPDAAQNRSQLSVLADQEGFLVAYGRGVDRRWQADIDSIDVEYVQNLINLLVGEWDADPERVFVAGMSNGADMAITAVLSLPDVIAAAAPIVPSSTMNVEGVIAELASPADVMAFVGTRDGRYESGLKLLASMRAGAACGTEDRVESEGLVTTTWPCGDDTTFVVHEVIDGGHAWFGFPTDREPIWASEAMWEFFQGVTS